mmetsp:Transcript_9374/g.17640  ORF Transcript_9374/g.17640 Transcript_9374/m.17640 type:complete len:106 (-) Transcript_9374:11-328(-)
MQGCGSSQLPRGFVITGGRLDAIEEITSASVDAVVIVDGTGILAPLQPHFTSIFKAAGAVEVFFDTIVLFQGDRTVKAVLNSQFRKIFITVFMFYPEKKRALCTV